ncbi:Protein of unknown function [Paracidovorax valerianellae]|uniref:DUF3034 family protein n=2 Tax=Paracidovorax valerianellae TaxID=187868 RepID=A0A1G6M950_9BURK|nr:DUF3034 family protein [Paracidovorax valerianellae]MDA8444080.1 DUF3034 family protein [Paracidovorax valerianellae]SDC51814.1 Protein of unknown function [Paracidovorax valerianellae]
MHLNPWFSAVACTTGFFMLVAATGSARAETGKLLLTGGVSNIAGSAGGGLTPWAVIGSNAAEGEIGISAFTTRTRTRDYGLTSYGAALGWNERVEVSVARQNFDAAPAVALNGVAAFGVEPDLHLKMDIVGVKVRLLGDAVLDADNAMPQVAVGVEHKRLDPASAGKVIEFLGADTSGTDLYVTATKLLLDRNLVLSATLRYTNANQNGLLGFGGSAPGRSRRSLQPEISVAYLLRRDLAIGAEYRFKPNNLQAIGASAGLGAALREDDWRDVFIAWAPNKHTSITLAYVNLGLIVPGVTGYRRQTGLYLSLQAAY